ncbi:MAG: hypothetical protein WC708_16100 [Lentisphaeria bacterium]
MKPCFVMGVLALLLATGVFELALAQEGVTGLNSATPTAAGMTLGTSATSNLEKTTGWLEENRSKLILVAIFSVCVGMIIGMFKGRLMMGLLLSLFLGPVGWLVLIFFVKRQEEPSYDELL